VNLSAGLQNCFSGQENHLSSKATSQTRATLGKNCLGEIF